MNYVNMDVSFLLYEAKAFGCFPAMRFPRKLPLPRKFLKNAPLCMAPTAFLVAPATCSRKPSRNTASLEHIQSAKRLKQYERDGEHQHLLHRCRLRRG